MKRPRSIQDVLDTLCHPSMSALNCSGSIERLEGGATLTRGWLGYPFADCGYDAIEHLALVPGLRTVPDAGSWPYDVWWAGPGDGPGARVAIQRVEGDLYVYQGPSSAISLVVLDAIASAA